MPTFRLAMRQFAIKKEFELGIESSSPIKHRGFCKGGDCPWRIYAREEIKGSPTNIVRFIMVYLIHKLHYMFCSMAFWLANVALHRNFFFAGDSVDE
jgi:hypothetical protein